MKFCFATCLLKIYHIYFTETFLSLLLLNFLSDNETHFYYYAYKTIIFSCLVYQCGCYVVQSTDNWSWHSTCKTKFESLQTLGQL